MFIIKDSTYSIAGSGLFYPAAVNGSGALYIFTAAGWNADLPRYWDGSIFSYSSIRFAQAVGSTTYTAVPTWADGYWTNAGGSVSLTVSGDKTSYGGNSGWLESDDSGALYIVGGGTRSALPSYTWSKEAVYYAGAALTWKSSSSSSAGYANLPAAAYGTWAYNHLTFSVADTINGSVYSGIMQCDGAGLIYTYSPLPMTKQ